MKDQLTSLSFFRFTLYPDARLTVTACKDTELLNPTPATAISGANAFDTPDRILGLVNGIYKAVKNGNYYGGNYYTYQEARGEEFINRTNNTFTAYEAWTRP